MSSIDKYVADTARQKDSRCRVTNQNGRIVGRINGQVVFDIADRYGYLSDSERQTIRAGIDRYTAGEEAERKRRAEEEARRRAEEEARRRRLEQERQAALAEAKAALAAKKKEADTYFSRLEKKIQSGGIDVPKEVEELLDVREVTSEARGELSSSAQAASRALQAARKSVMDTLESSERALTSSCQTATARSVKTQIQGIHPSFDDAPFREKNDEIVEAFNATMKACTNVLRRLKEVQRTHPSPEIDALFRRIKNVPIRSVEDLKKVKAMIEQALQSAISAEERTLLEDSLKELNQANEGLSVLRLSSDVDGGVQYEIPTFTEEISSVKSEIIGLREQLISAEYTSASVSTMEQVTEYLSCGEVGEEQFKKGQEIADMLRAVALQDERLRPAYDAFLRAKEEAESLGVPVDMEFDPRDAEGQLEQLAEAVATAEIAEESKERWNRVEATRALMDGLRWELISIKEEEGIVSLVYAKEGVRGAVMQVNVTEDGIRRRLIGVRTNGLESSVETVKEAARVIEREEEPSRFMEGYTMLFPEAQLAEDYGLSDTEGIEEVIERAAVYDLDADGKTEVYSSIVGEEIRDLTRIESVQYVQAKSITLEASLKADSKQHKTQKTQKAKERFMKRKP